MKVLVFLLVFCFANGYSQQIEWAPGTVLELSDFKHPGTDFNGNIVTLHPGVSIGFGYQMMTAQLMFTKNFNSKVSCTFNPQNALLVVPDESSAGRVLVYAQYCFDIAELYARKLRKLLYESKKATSSPDFFRVHYETIEQAMTLRVTEAGKKTNLGENMALLQQLHAEVLAEIETYPDFCKSCKPKRK